jgi:tetratricopeptide (TPR) repeat protein
MKKILIIILGLIFSLVSLYSQSTKDYEKGDNFMTARQYEKAAEEYSKLIVKDPKDAYAVYKRGVAYLFMNNFAAAISDFDSALKINGDDPDSYNNRGLALSYQGELTRAMSDFDKAIELDPGFAQAYINRGSAYVATNQHDKAVKDFDKAIKIDPGNPEIFLQRARLFYIQTDYEKSLKDYNSAIALGLGSSKVYYNRGNTYFKMEKYDEAIKDYSTALELDPDDFDALNNRSYTYNLLDMVEEAERDKKLLNEKRNAIFTPIEQINFKTFESKGGDLTLELPEDWKLVDMPYEDEDRTEFVITPEEVDINSEGMVVGVTIGVLRNLSKTMPVRTEPEILDFWKGSMDQSNQELFIYKVFWQRHLQLFGHATILNRATVQASENHLAFGMFEYMIAWGDNLIYMYFQAPEANFDYFEKIYERAYKSIIISESLKLTYE